MLLQFKELFPITRILKYLLLYYLITLQKTCSSLVFCLVFQCKCLHNRFFNQNIYMRSKTCFLSNVSKFCEFTVWLKQSQISANRLRKITQNQNDVIYYTPRCCFMQGWGNTRVSKWNILFKLKRFHTPLTIFKQTHLILFNFASQVNIYGFKDV